MDLDNDKNDMPAKNLLQDRYAQLVEALNSANLPSDDLTVTAIGLALVDQCIEFGVTKDQFFGTLHQMWTRCAVAKAKERRLIAKRESKEEPSNASLPVCEAESQEEAGSSKPEQVSGSEE